MALIFVLFISLFHSRYPFLLVQEVFFLFLVLQLITQQLYILFNFLKFVLVERFEYLLLDKNPD